MASAPSALSNSKMLPINASKILSSNVGADVPFNTDHNLKTFTCFEKLPLELQLIIWKLHNGCRTIEIRFTKDTLTLQFDFVSSIPTSLHINKMVRKESLKSYQLLFEHKQDRSAVFFDPEVDTLHIRSQNNLDGPIYRQIHRVLSDLPDKNKIQHLSCDESLLVGRGLAGLDFNPYKPFILQFANLRTFDMCFKMGNTAESGGRQAMSHRSECNPTAPSGVCFPKISDIADNCFQGDWWRSQLWAEKWVFAGKKFITKFLENVEMEKWGEVEWKIPKFYHKPMCYKGLESSMFCPSECERKAAAAQRELANATKTATKTLKPDIDLSSIMVVYRHTLRAARRRKV